MISVSMDGASPETYVRYRRGGDFALVLGNMERLAARKRALGLTYPLIEWRFLVFRHNHHEIDRAREMAAELGLDLLEFFYGYALAEGGPDDVLRWDGPIPGLPISGPAWDRGLQRRDTRLRAHLFPNSYSYSLPPPPASRSKKCDWLYFSTMLYPDAAAGPCCVAMSTSDDFGRLEPGLTFSELWNNPNYRNARDLFNGGGDRNLVCARCPMPGAMDYQFVTSLRAILLNAPDWVLTILGRSPEDFFHEVDFALFGKELEAVRAVAAETDPADAATLARLDAAGAQSAALAAHAARFKARLRDAAAAGRQDRVLQPAH